MAISSAAMSMAASSSPSQRWEPRVAATVTNTPPTPTLPPIPDDAIIIVPVRNLVLLPNTLAPITIGRPKSIAAAQQAVREQRLVGILMQRANGTEDPTAIEMHRVGTVANIVRYVTAPDVSHH